MIPHFTVTSPFFSAIHTVIAALFVCVALMLVLIAVKAGWAAVGADAQAGAEAIIETIGLLAVAVVSLQIAQTIMEEEVIRTAQISAPTRVRRYLSRFLVVVVVALAGWGSFIWFNRVAEDLEPEAMEQAKQEDQKLE